MKNKRIKQWIEQVLHLNIRAFLVAEMVKNLHAMQEIWVLSLSLEDALEEEMATYSSILALRIPQTERNMEGYSPLCCQELDTTEWPTLLLSLYLSIREATKMTSDGRKFGQKETWREILLQKLKERKEVPIKLRRYFTLDLGFLLRKAECDIMFLPWKSKDCVYELRLVEKSLK